MPKINPFPLDYKSMTDDEFDEQMAFDIWHKKNKGLNGRYISKYEAKDAFLDGLYVAVQSYILNGGKYPQIAEEWLVELNRKPYETKLDFERARAYPIAELVQSFGFEIRQNKIPCPFHQDPNASLHIYQNTNSFYCFGCNKGGSTIDFMMGMTGCTLKEATIKLT
jgi:hypothetical protein